MGPEYDGIVAPVFAAEGALSDCQAKSSSFAARVEREKRAPSSAGSVAGTTCERADELAVAASQAKIVAIQEIIDGLCRSDRAKHRR